MYKRQLLALLVLSTGIGALIHPPLGAVLPASPGGEGGEARHTVELASAVVGIGGIALAALLFLGRRRLVDMIAQSAAGRFIGNWWLHAFGFDALYQLTLVRPFLFAARQGRRDVLDGTMTLIPTAVRAMNRLAVMPQTGKLRWYIASMAIGAVLILGAVVITL